MNERMQKLIEEARELSPEERPELLAAPTAVTKGDEATIEEFELRLDDIGAESLGYMT